MELWIMGEMLTIWYKTIGTENKIFHSLPIWIRKHNEDCTEERLKMHHLCSLEFSLDVGMCWVVLSLCTVTFSKLPTIYKKLLHTLLSPSTLISTPWHRSGMGSLSQMRKLKLKERGSVLHINCSMLPGSSLPGLSTSKIWKINSKKRKCIPFSAHFGGTSLNRLWVWILSSKDQMFLQEKGFLNYEHISYNFKKFKAS